jgi:predicted transposase YbfD/YdcC
MASAPDSAAASRPRDPASILNHFDDLPDPRREQGRIHRLDEIVFIATCAVLCGADTWVQIADYGRSKFDWLATFLELPGGIPSHDTFRRTFCLIDPAAFQGCFSSWIAAMMARTGLTPVVPAPSELTPIAIDGKAQRGSARHAVGRSALHVVSAWAVENRLTLGQVATDAKSNEITAIPELLALLDLKGAVVTIDAMGCQKEIAAEIIAGEGEYLLAVKENQPHLYEDIGREFDEALESGEPGVDFTECQTEEVRGGRRETRTCCVITHPRGIRDARLWAGLTAIVMVISHREIDGVGAGPLGDRERAALGPGCLFPRGRPAALGGEQRPEPRLAEEDGAVPAQGGEEQQGEEYRHSPPPGRVEGRLLIECIGSNPREFWCVSPADWRR